MNRGSSGNTVRELQKRWEKDTLELKPDVLSILIGVNDQSHDVPLARWEDNGLCDQATGIAASLRFARSSNYSEFRNSPRRRLRASQRERNDMSSGCCRFPSSKVAAPIKLFRS